MALGIPEAIAELAKLLSKALGYVVDPTGLEQHTREGLLKVIMRGVNESIAHDDWGTYDALMGRYRELRQQTS